jgi:hypothetical protein
MKATWMLATLLVLMSLAAGCGGAGSRGPGTEHDPNVITLAEIEAGDVETAYQLVQQLRPRWLSRSRGERSLATDQADYTRVVVDDMPPREFDHLHEIPRSALVELRLLLPREATLLYGTGFNSGVIRVTTRR